MFKAKKHSTIKITDSSNAIGDSSKANTEITVSPNASTESSNANPEITDSSNAITKSSPVNLKTGLAQTGFAAFSFAVNSIELLFGSYLCVILSSQTVFLTRDFWLHSQLNGHIFQAVWTASFWLSSFVLGYFTVKQMAKLKKAVPVQMSMFVFLAGVCPWLLAILLSLTFSHHSLSSLAVYGGPVLVLLGQITAMRGLKKNA